MFVNLKQDVRHHTHGGVTRSRSFRTFSLLNQFFPPSGPVPAPPLPNTEHILISQWSLSSGVPGMQRLQPRCSLSRCMPQKIIWCCTWICSWSSLNFTSHPQWLWTCIIAVACREQWHVSTLLLLWPNTEPLLINSLSTTSGLWFRLWSGFRSALWWTHLHPSIHL